MSTSAPDIREVCQEQIHKVKKEYDNLCKMASSALDSSSYLVESAFVNARTATGKAITKLKQAVYKTLGAVEGEIKATEIISEAFKEALDQVSKNDTELRRKLSARIENSGRGR